MPENIIPIVIGNIHSFLCSDILILYKEWNHFVCRKNDNMQDAGECKRKENGAHGGISLPSVVLLRVKAPERKIICNEITKPQKNAGKYKLYEYGYKPSQYTCFSYNVTSDIVQKKQQFSCKQTGYRTYYAFDACFLDRKSTRLNSSHL